MLLCFSDVEIVFICR